VSIKVVHFVNSLGIGGTEKAAMVWGKAIVRRGGRCWFITLSDGVRKTNLENAGIPVYSLSGGSADKTKYIANIIGALNPDVIHAHVPGYPHEGDMLGESLFCINKKIPVIQTNVFGLLRNPREDEWTDMRAFVSFTSCVQAAAREKLSLNDRFFRNKTVIGYPLDSKVPFSSSCRDIQSKTFNETTKNKIVNYRAELGVLPNHVLFGKFARPDSVKWSYDLIQAFDGVHRRYPDIRLLLREVPDDIRRVLVRKSRRNEISARSIILLRATSDEDDLLLSQLSCDVILHTSKIGESFGYGLAEPMSYGKPVITNSVPWGDQAQLELTNFGRCGIISTSQNNMINAIACLAQNPQLRLEIGQRGKDHILRLTNLDASMDRLMRVYESVVLRKDNPFLEEDLQKAKVIFQNLNHCQWGDSSSERIANYLRYYRFWSYRYIQVFFGCLRKAVE